MSFSLMLMIIDLILLFPLQTTGNLRVLRTNTITLLTDCLQARDDDDDDYETQEGEDDVTLERLSGFISELQIRPEGETCSWL